MRKLLLPLLICTSIFAKAQDVLDLKLDGSEEGKSLSTVLNEVEKKNNARFYFLPEWIAPVSFQKSYAGQTLAAALDDLFQGTGLSFFAMYPNAIVIVKDARQAFARRTAIEAAIQQKKKIEPRLFGEIGKAKKGPVTINGKVTDAKSKLPLVHANVQVSDTQDGTSTDEAGNYSLSFSSGPHVLVFSFVDYEDKVVDLAAYTDGEINLELEEMPIMLQEVNIQDQSMRELTSNRIGQTQLAIRELKRSPTLLGEADLVKQVQTLPGVTTVGEAAAGFNVRGGSVDQNLVLYDGMPVFNSSHVFGFLSAFNSEAVRDVSFYKGAIPSEYGGRASSVLDIHSRDGNSEGWHGNAGIGMITSNIMVNGPLNKDKTTMAASVRSTYSNWLIHSIRTDYADLKNSSVFFYDGTLKVTHRFTDHTRLSITGYSSQDAFRLSGDSTYRWNNLQLSAKLDHQFSTKLSGEFVLGRSSYGYSVVNSDYLTAAVLSYRITSTAAKAGFIYQQGNHKINFGWQLLHYRFDPGTFKPDSPGSTASTIILDKQHSIENAFYASEDWSFNDKIFIDAGLRLPMFIPFGQASVNVYDGSKPRETDSVIDTLHFRSGQPIKAFFGAEPRISFRWMLSPTTSFKAGYNRMYQYLHLVTNTTAVTPVDIWQPSGYYFKPQRADQVSAGFFKDFREKKYAASIEAYYKDVENVLDFKDGAQLILNKHLETDLLQGKAWAYGLETSITKTTGRLSGSLNYTYSRSFRRIAGPTLGESINQGNTYRSNFDQPHIINLQWKYNLSRRHFFTANFTYHTGRPVTVPLSAFPIENGTVAYFSGRNQYRIPDYHRLDLALVIEGNHRKNQKWKGTWVISVYNAYAHKNVYTVFFKSTNGGVPKPYQLSIVGTILPSISYNIKF